MNIIICTLKSWNIDYANKLKLLYKKQHNILVISNKEDLTYNKIKEFEPNFILFPHWSYIIPKDIYQNWNCIVFHMTDLPFGRGGSPLQNLIDLGMNETKISAIKVNDIIDGGPIYMKSNLNLNGSAEEIFLRASKVMFNEMIPFIVNNNPQPQEQEGNIVTFKRRTPEQSELYENMSLEKIYDYIRMLDAEGYPHSFIKFGNYKLSFSRASLKNGKIIADVEIEEDKHE